MGQTFQIGSIGVVHKQEDRNWIDLEPQFQDGLLGLGGFSHVIVLYWFDRNDTPQDRRTLQVHPRKNPANPLTGVFATHAPVRPNLIAVSVCQLISIENNRLYLDAIDALDGSPVIDIKCYIPSRESTDDVRLPGWVTNNA